MMKTSELINIGLLVILISGCSWWKTTEPPEKQPVGPIRPIWVDNPGSVDDPDFPKIKHFVGVSDKYTSERTARTGATDHASELILQFLGVFSEQFIVDVSVVDANTEEIMGNQRKKDAISRKFADAFIAGVAAKKYHTDNAKTPDQYGDEREYFKVYVLIPFSRQESDRALAKAIDFEKNEKLKTRADSLANMAWKKFEDKLKKRR